ncbi:MAG: hypothetical protein JWM49_1936 [Microbacteriaceae bacterium]|nr:hypothetical protein [Microbacteriaceae bacterium]
MALSDLMLRLGSQAKDLEDSASALHTDNDARLKARASELHKSLSKIKVALGQELEADSDVAANRWAGLQRTVSDGFEALRTQAAARAADPAVQADTAARRAELDAEDAIDFAVYALQEAEYSVLAALAARGGADDLADAEFDAEIDSESADEVIATGDEIAVDDIVVTDGETAVEDIIDTDGDSAVETVDTIDIDDPATADEEPTK